MGVYMCDREALTATEFDGFRPDNTRNNIVVLSWHRRHRRSHRRNIPKQHMPASIAKSGAPIQHALAPALPREARGAHTRTARTLTRETYPALLDKLARERCTDKMVLNTHVRRKRSADVPTAQN